MTAIYSPSEFFPIFSSSGDDVLVYAAYRRASFWWLFLCVFVGDVYVIPCGRRSATGGVSAPSHRPGNAPSGLAWVVDDQPLARTALTSAEGNMLT